MVIISHYILSISGNSTIYKFIIIWICFNDFETIEWCDKNRIGIVNDDINCKACKIVAGLSLKYFFILFQYLICHTHLVATIQEREPQLMITAAT